MISKLSEEKMSAIQQNQKLRQELVCCPEIVAVNTVVWGIILEVFHFHFHAKYFFEVTLQQLSRLDSSLFP
jgi:hypothetical protein